MDAVAELSIFCVVVFEGGGMRELISRRVVTRLSADCCAESGAGGGEVVESIGVVVGVASVEALGLGKGVLLF